jgi:energy-coupling factor transporter ATP-binding protein EcfA2
MIVAATTTGAAAAVGTGLWKRWQERIIDHADLAISRLFSRFDRRYRSLLLGSLRFVETKGLATVGPFTPELDEIYVDVGLTFSAPHQVPEGIVAQQSTEATGRYCLWNFLDKAEPQILAVVGAPGSGKTTLLRHTARMACQNTHGRRTLPLLLYLRDHARAIVDDPNITLPELVRRSLAPYAQLKEPAGWFEQRLRAGTCIVLLDGLDEVGRVADRTEVASWVDRQTRQYGTNDFVITSRPHGYRTAPIDGAVVLQVRAFTSAQVRRLVNGWYLAAERHGTGEHGSAVELRATTEATDLLERLNATPGLYELTANPLLLTMIANVHRYRGALPGSRVELYGEMCQVMLWRRQEAKKLPAEISGEKKEGLLRRLAFTMMEHRVRDLPRDDVIAEIEPALRRMSGRVDAAAFLADVGSNGLLVERESGLYAFAHLTFQEYLAASHLRDIGNGHVLATTVDDLWWRETTLLYAARSNADPVVVACLNSLSGTALSLAFDCADEDSDIDPTLRDRLEALLTTVSTEECDAERRQMMSRALVTRLLHQVRHTESGGRVCVRPVPVGVYRLFLQDTGRPALEHSGRAPGFNDPMTGMWAGDAANFVTWLNRITGGEPTCRLPTRAELDDPLVQHARKALSSPPAPAWLSGHTDALWTPDNDHPHAVEAHTLSDRVVTDLTEAAPILTRLLLLHSMMLSQLLDDDRDAKFARLDHFDVIDNLDSYLRRTYDQTLELVLHADPTTAIRPRPEDQASALHVAQLLTTGRQCAEMRRRCVQDATEGARKLARDFAPTPDLGMPRALDNALDLDRTRVQSLFRGRTAAEVHEGSFAEVTGAALARSLARAVPVRAADWPIAFARVFASVTGADAARTTVSLDSLSARMKASAAMARRLRSWPPNTRTTWADVVTTRLLAAATPIFERRRPLDNDTATAIRIAALCLAVEVDEHATELGAIFREVAAGVTLLQRRGTGLAPAPETIVLATA